MDNTELWTSIGLSIRVALVAVAASLPIGVAMGWLLARRRFRGKGLLEICVNLPLVLPPVVTGYLLLVICGRYGWIGIALRKLFGTQIVFTWWAAVLASAVVSFPLMVRAIRLSFMSVDRRLEDASRTLGVGPLATFFRITLPLARQGLIAGCLLAFARGVGEFGATIMVAGSIPGETRTIPLEIYSLFQSATHVSQIWWLVAASVAISAAALAMGGYLERRGKVME